MKSILTSLLLIFIASFCSAQNEMLILKTNGKVVIGDTTQISTPGTYNLYVQNGILTERVKVALKSAADWSDDSFDKTPSLYQIKQSIELNSHLPNIPSANEVVEDGYELQAMDAKLLEQIEWLWQYTIKLDEENKKLRAEINALKDKK